MKDILLNRDGDLYIGDDGDIAITDSVRQAVKIRLQWFLYEWKFYPDTGVPYFEDILVKNPSIDKIRGILRDEIMSVDDMTRLEYLT